MAEVYPGLERSKFGDIMSFASRWLPSECLPLVTRHVYSLHVLRCKRSPTLIGRFLELRTPSRRAQLADSGPLRQRRGLGPPLREDFPPAEARSSSSPSNLRCGRSERG